jgi:hypothetical protein
MKANKQLFVALGLMILVSALYRVMPNRPLGFAPQIAVALFAGSLFHKNKGYAFLLPLLSMFISDLMYHVLYINQISTTEGFYDGQVENYILIALTTIFGFGLQTSKIGKFAMNFFAAPTMYFLVSNFLVWSHGGGYQRPFTTVGLMQTMVDGLPFYPYSVASTFVFGALLFGTHKLAQTRFKTA